VWPPLHLIEITGNDRAIEKRVVCLDHPFVEPLGKVPANVSIPGFEGQILVFLWRLS
jgi:hypothetical protein